MKKLTWADGILPVLDFETTGVGVENDRVIQAALILEASGGYILPGSLITYVNPGAEALERMAPEATAQHGITKELILEQGVDSLEVFLEIHSMLIAIHRLGLPLVAYNLPFDWRVLHYECRRHGLPDPPPLRLVDALLLDYKVDKYRKGSRKLTALAEHYEVELKDAHHAGADCVATAEVLRRILKIFSRLRAYTLDDLYRLQKKWFDKWKEDRNRYWASIGKDARIDHSWPGM